MSRQHEGSRQLRQRWAWAAFLCLLTASAAGGTQQPASPDQQAPPSSPAPSTPATSQAPGTTPPTGKDKAPTHITLEQAKQLFALVDELLKFSSGETGLQVK